MPIHVFIGIHNPLIDEFNSIRIAQSASILNVPHANIGEVERGTVLELLSARLTYSHETC